MDLHDRLRTAIGKQTYKRVGDLTGTHPETVRRYLQGQSPSVEFLTSLCRATGINPTWLLAGQGPMRLSEVRRHALQDADASELLAAMADTIAALTARIERLEIYSQSLETQLRGLRESGTTGNKGGDERSDEHIRVVGQASGQSSERTLARRIASATERPPQDADRADGPCEP